ncbi:MAG TPA: hypothetical protein VNB22_06995 [Pyrinomonadaceae bacterium]|jgi:hypothetical protein|nr:hypothetical protein [Pyrinomonadaceae bacterium]
MPDISMCANKRCPSKNSCFRFKAKPNGHRQCYSDFKPDESGKCSSYRKVTPEDKAKGKIANEK